MSVLEDQGFFFLDTNVLVYAFDHSAPEKQRIARRLIGEALNSHRGIISTQVVQEFIHLALRKFQQPMTFAECRQHLRTVLMPLCQHFPTLSYYDRTLQIMQQTGYAFYDSLIVAAAIESDCQTLLSEDMQHGRVIQGLRVVNPFLAEGGWPGPRGTDG